MIDDRSSLDSRPATGRDDDPHARLPKDELRHLARCATALLDGVALPEQVHENWPVFFRLAASFADMHGSAQLGHLRDQATLFEGWGDDPLTDDDRTFLVRLLNEVRDVLREAAVAAPGAPGRLEAEGTR